MAAKMLTNSNRFRMDPLTASSSVSAGSSPLKRSSAP